MSNQNIIRVKMLMKIIGAEYQYRVAQWLPKLESEGAQALNWTVPVSISMIMYLIMVV